MTTVAGEEEVRRTVSTTVFKSSCKSTDARASCSSWLSIRAISRTAGDQPVESLDITTHHGQETLPVVVRLSVGNRVCRGADRRQRILELVRHVGGE